MKGTLKTLVSLALLGAVLYFTNPGMEDFGRFYEKRQVAASQKNVTRVFKDIAKAVAQTGSDLVVKLGFKREDKLLFSFFTLGPASNPSKRFVGFGKLIFIELK